ncbi:MAG: hypothetical protein ACR2RB_13435 [Gammaproteobacteria bacterium]
MGSGSEIHLQPPPAQHAKTPVGYSILVAHRHLFWRQRVADVLRRESSVENVVLVRSGRKALQRLHRAEFDALIMGEQLADGDAWRFVDSIRSARPYHADLPILVVAKSPKTSIHAFGDNTTLIPSDQIHAVADYLALYVPVATR